MSLVRLLATGKSLIGLSQPGSRYRIPRKNPLPKFGSDKNPFVNPTKREAAQVEEPSADAVRPPLSAAEQEAANLKETRRIPFLAAPAELNQAPEQPQSPPAPKPRRVRAALGFVGRLLGRLNPLAKFSREAGAMTSAGPRAVKPAQRPAQVQGELSLDNIKVVRNDLSDADLEIVPVKSNPPVEEESIPELPPAKNAWEYLGERLLSHNR